MQTVSANAVEYKIRQRKIWDSTAAGWGKWWPKFEQGAQVISDRMVELAAIAPGTRVLDLATGIGEPAITAARVVGATGMVVATDLSTEMLAIGRKRAERESLENIAFLHLDAEDIYQIKHKFDAILCRWGLFFLPNLGSALIKIRQRLTPKGRIVAAVWDKPQKVSGLSLPMKVVAELLKLTPPQGPGVFSLSDPAALKGIFSDSGFTKIHLEELMLTAEFTSAYEFTQFTQDISAPVKMLIADQPLEKRAAVWDAVTKAAGKYAGPDGRIKMPMTSIIIAASGKER